MDYAYPGPDASDAWNVEAASSDFPAVGLDAGLGQEVLFSNPGWYPHNNELPLLDFAGQPLSINDDIAYNTNFDQPDPLNAPNSKATRGSRSHGARVDWEQHKSFIQQHYMTLDRSLADTINALQSEKGIHTSERQLKYKLKTWGFEKNLKPKHVKFIKKKALSRQRKHNRKTEFTINGAPVDSDEVERHCQGHTYSELPPTDATPSAITYRTPVDNEQNPYSTSFAKVTVDAPSTTIHWCGQSIEDLRKLLEQSFEAAHGLQGQSFLDALPHIQEGIDGLEALVGPTHFFTVRAINELVHLALHCKQTEEAETRLLKSVTDHQTHLGHENQKTYECVARVALFYHALSRLGEAEKLLVDALNGINSLDDLDAESRFSSSHAFIGKLCEILQKQGNFMEAEAVLQRHIAQAKTFGSAYSTIITELKLDLARLYSDPDWRRMEGDGIVRPPPMRKILGLLEGLVDDESITRNQRIYPWLMLMERYVGQRDQTKLSAFCPRTETFLTSLGQLSLRNHSDVVMLRDKLSQGFALIGETERAEWWLINQQDRVDNSADFGPSSKESFEAKVKHALFFLNMDQRKNAETHLLDAQDKAKSLFKEGHAIHNRIAECLNGGQWIASCGGCGIYSAADSKDDSAHRIHDNSDDSYEEDDSYGEDEDVMEVSDS